MVRPATRELSVGQPCGQLCSPALISGSSGTAEAKKKAFEAKNVQVGRSPSEAAQIAAEIVAANG